MKYRPDIDGLRAIAILFVLFFHGGLKLFSSGFIGVDIFFVISGFLITSIIHDSLQKDRFSFFEFYNRRLWRMQPALISLLVFATCVALFFYLPDDLLQFGKSLRKTSVFLSNTFFERITTGYFAPESNQLPLLHTWSLSIEWQCYLMLPLAIYVLDRIFAKKMTIIIPVLTVVFLAFTLYCSAESPTKTYYQLTSRIFEFLIGSTVALNHSRFTLNKYLLDTLTILAIVSLFYIATRANINQGFPNGYAFLLCSATGLLIASGQQYPQSLVTRLLSLKLIVFIGLISYSLYIWHWPIFALMRYLDFPDTPVILSIAFCFIFLVAYLSWRFLEKPTRRLNTTRFAYSLVYLFILPVALFHLTAHVIKKHEGFPARFAETSTIYQRLKHYQSRRPGQCLQQQDIEVDQNCVLGAKNTASVSGFMIGDSFSNHHWLFMDVLAKEAKVSIMAHATAACLSLPGIMQYGWYVKDKIYEECQAQTKRYYQMIQANHYNFVIIGQNWNGYVGNTIINHVHDERSVELSKARIAKALENALQIIVDSGARPVLLKATAITHANPNKCFFSHFKKHRSYDPAQCDFRFYPQDEVWVNELFSKMKKKFSQLIIIDPKKVQCPHDFCKADIFGIPVFRDAVHISDYASYQFGKRYLKKYKNPIDY